MVLRYLPMRKVSNSIEIIIKGFNIHQNLRIRISHKEISFYLNCLSFLLLFFAINHYQLQVIVFNAKKGFCLKIIRKRVYLLFDFSRKTFDHIWAPHLFSLFFGCRSYAFLVSSISLIFYF